MNRLSSEAIARVRVLVLRWDLGKLLEVRAIAGDLLASEQHQP